MLCKMARHGNKYTLFCKIYLYTQRIKGSTLKVNAIYICASSSFYFS